MFLNSTTARLRHRDMSKKSCFWIYTDSPPPLSVAVHAHGLFTVQSFVLWNIQSPEALSIKDLINEALSTDFFLAILLSTLFCFGVMRKVNLTVGMSSSCVFSNVLATLLL